MESSVMDLLGIVREEISLYRDLIEHTRRKTSLLVQGSVDAILESNKAEETFNIKLRILENEMIRLCSDLCEAFKIPRDEFTLLKLADGVDQSVAAEIRSQTNLFRNLVDQLKTINQRNMKLVECSISYSRGLLDFISNATSPYQGTGLFRPFPAIQTTISHQA
jgi:flagellar FlgN protein